MPVPSTIADLSTVAADNSPQGGEAIGTSLDDYLRTCFAFIRQVNDASNFISTSPTYSSNANLAPIVNSSGTGWLYKTAAQFLSWLGLGVANAASGVVVLDSSSRLPAVSGALLTGINIGVSSVNGNAGAITAAQIAAAATAGYGYTPGKTGATFSWSYVGNFNPTTTNIYANYGAGVYSAESEMFAIHASQTISQNLASTTFNIYKLVKD